MKYLFFLIVLLIPIGLASAETGKNFDTIDNQDGTTTWASHYERVFDGISWKNYILNDNLNQITFDGSGGSFLFYKATCNFKLYDPNSKALEINSYSFVLSIDGIAQPSLSCTITNLIQSEDATSFYINQDLFKTKIDLSPSSGLEWTHEIDNNQGKGSTFTITETCTDCIVSSIEGNKIDFGAYTLDTKNEIHNTVNETKSMNGD